MSLILEFLQNKQPHPNGMYLNDILNADDNFWEECHDFIQWVFPLNEASQFNLNAPILSEDDLNHLKMFEYQNVILGNYLRFLNFLALDLSFRCHWYWLTPDNHNYLRITRIIKCLKLANLNEIANLFVSRLERLAENFEREISTDNLKYWKLALK